MNGIIRQLWLIPIIMIGLTNLAWAGAWTPDKGTMYAKLSVDYFRSTNLYNNSGDIVSLSDNGISDNINARFGPSTLHRGRTTKSSTE